MKLRLIILVFIISAIAIGILPIRADNKRISLKFISVTGQVVDCVDDLMEIKKKR